MKVALVHDWLTGMRGGERCLQAFLTLYPQADIFTMFHVKGSTSEGIDKRVKQVSSLNLLPGVRRYYRLLLPFYPLAIRELDLKGHDLIISLSHAAAKNVRVPDGAVHICFCFTPMRYVWDQASVYFGRLTFLLWPIIMLLRRWDMRGSKGVTHFAPISRFIKARIRRFYHRPSTVVYPPVDASWITGKTAPDAAAQLHDPAQASFLYAGALVPYKGVDTVVEAFSRLGLPLTIVGSGPEQSKLKRMAGRNINFVGRVSDQELAQYYRSCRALVFPAREDFGLVPIECMAAGRPVIALYAGACRETVVGLRPWDHKTNRLLDSNSVTGVFIRKTDRSKRTEALIESVRYFMTHESLISSEACRKRAAKYSLIRFFEAWQHLMVELGIVKIAAKAKVSDVETEAAVI